MYILDFGADEHPCATYFDVHQRFPGFDPQPLQHQAVTREPSTEAAELRGRRGVPARRQLAAAFPGARGVGGPGARGVPARRQLAAASPGARGVRGPWSPGAAQGKAPVGSVADSWQTHSGPELPGLLQGKDCPRIQLGTFWQLGQAGSWKGCVY